MGVPVNQNACFSKIDFEDKVNSRTFYCRLLRGGGWGGGGGGGLYIVLLAPADFEVGRADAPSSGIQLPADPPKGPPFVLF